MVEKDFIPMFFADPAISFVRAWRLCNNMTVAEKILWEKLKGNEVEGLRFRRQHPLGVFIADFYCHKVKLVIELDGEYHLSKEVLDYDKARGEAAWGITTLRFSNSNVITDLSAVVNSIAAKIREVRKQVIVCGLDPFTACAEAKAVAQGEGVRRPERASKYVGIG